MILPNPSGPLKHPRIVIDAADLAARLSLKGADAIYVATSHQQALPLVSWDREQLTRAAAVLSDSYTPATFVY